MLDGRAGMIGCSAVQALTVFAPGHGTALINDYVDLDTIDLTAFGFANFQEAKSFASNIDGDVVFDFTGDEH